MTTTLATPTARVILGSDKTPSDAEWHATRARGIGSSDAAGILGVSPWNSPYSLWLEKTGRVTSDKESEPMRWGQVLEGPIAEEFGSRQELAVLPAPGVLAHVDVDWLLASPDRMLASLDDPRPFSFVEVKNVSAWKSGEWDAEAGVMPSHYLIQILHQLAVTGYDEASVACLIGGQRLEHLTVQRDDALIDQMLSMEEAFWKLVQSDTPPPFDGFPPTIDAVRAYRAEAGRVYDVTDDDLPLIAVIRERKADSARLRAELKAADVAEKAAIAELQAKMAGAEFALSGDDILCTWKEASRAGYTVAPTTVRTFRLSK